MADNVFVNGRSVIHAGSAGQSTAFPDVNLCPPAPPAGPIPTPLPNLALGADLDGGASSVVVEGNPMGKRSSFLSKSTGNEVAQSTGGGVVSHVVQGKAYFASYSLDVTVEGEEVPRHLDMMTHNHAAQSPPNAAVGTYLGMMDPGVIPPASDPEPENKLTSYKVFLSAAPGRAADHVDSYELASLDEEYKKVIPASAGQRAGDLTAIEFKDLLPGKFYRLTRLVGGDSAHLIPLFEHVAFAVLLQESPAAPPPPPPPPRKAAPAPAPEDPPGADPLIPAQPIDVGDDWYWAHHAEPDDELERDETQEGDGDGDGDSDGDGQGGV